jgi:hypothetical protein
MEQEKLYAIRRMTFDEFQNKYSSESGLREIFEYFKKVSDLNIVRNAGMDEIDTRLVEMIKLCVSGEELDNGAYIQRKWKTMEVGE